MATITIEIYTSARDPFMRKFNGWGWSALVTLLFGYRIREVPLAGHRPRVAGSQTGARLDVITRAFRELIRFRWRLWVEG